VSSSCEDCGGLVEGGVCRWCYDGDTLVEPRDPDDLDDADRPDLCRVCADFGETQCDVHGPAVIALMASMDAEARAADALRDLAQSPPEVLASDACRPHLEGARRALRRTVGRPS